MTNTNDVKHISPILRYSELIRQKLLPAVSFVSTPNQRNLRMIKETNRYCRLAKHFVKKVKAISRATDDLMSEAEHVIESPLPREFTMKAGVLKAVGEALDAEGTRADVTAGGGPLGSGPGDRMQTQELRDSFKSDLEAQVYGPINQFLTRQAEARKTFRANEMIRYELDAARRLLVSLQAKSTKLANAGKAEEEAYIKLQERIQLVQGQADHFGPQYDAAEEALNAELHAIIDSATVLQQALNQALLLEAKVLTAMASPSGFVEKSFMEAAKPDPEEDEAMGTNSTKEAATTYVAGKAPAVAAEGAKGSALAASASGAKSAYA